MIHCGTFSDRIPPGRSSAASGKTVSCRAWQALIKRGMRGRPFGNRTLGWRRNVDPVQEAARVASVAELRAAVEAALQQVTEGQQAIQAAREKIGEAQQSLAAALDGSANDAVGAAHASLSQADQQLEDSMSATLAAVEQAHTYTANL